MIEVGEEPARLLALELLQVENVPKIFGPLYLENVANCLFHCLGTQNILALYGKGLGLAPILGQAHPWARVRWHQKLRRELANPYGDDKVFERIRTLEKRIPRPLLAGSNGWLCGSFCKATFSAHSDLDIALHLGTEREAQLRLTFLTYPDPEINFFLLPLESQLCRVESLLLGPITPLRDSPTLEELYWQILQLRGFDLTPRPRVVGLPWRRQREFPLWLENFFKRTHPGRFQPSRVRPWIFRALGSLPGLQTIVRHWVPGGVLECQPLDRRNTPSASFRRASKESDTPQDYRELAAHLAQHPLPWFEIRDGQSPAKLFFAVVRWLGPHPLKPQAFRTWCHERRVDIQEQLRTRCLQVNSVRRAAYLVAGLGWIAQRWGLPIRLLEVGASAGLLLNFAHYRINYGQQTVGPGDSPVQIQCPTTGGPPSLVFEIQQRLGLDLRPLSAQDPEDCRWLECQSWDSKLLLSALHIARQHPPTVLALDVLQGLPQLEEVADCTQVIFHSHCWNQLSPERQVVLQNSSQRPGVVRLSLEWEDALQPLLRAHWQQGQQLLASCPRGQMEWLA